MGIFAQTVDHNHDSVNFICTGQTRDEIHGHFSPNMLGNRQRVEQTSGAKGLVFILLANLVVSDKILNILTHSFPIEGGRNLLVGAKEPQMNSYSRAVKLIQQNRNLKRKF